MRKEIELAKGDPGQKRICAKKKMEQTPLGHELQYTWVYMVRAKY